MGEREIYLSPAFARKVKKLRKQEKEELDEAVRYIQSDPSSGQQKVGDLAGVFVHKFKMSKKLTRLSYIYDEREINLLTFGSHENFYRDLKKYTKG